ncbi:MAG: hypothetical protein IJM17_08735 [Firmicutes bacterium]|nr:hypothetical protein [Bacillota bacterium]
MKAKHILASLAIVLASFSYCFADIAWPGRNLARNAGPIVAVCAALIAIVLYKNRR